MPIKRFDKTEQLAVGVGTAALTFTTATTGNRTYAAAGAEEGDQFWARIQHEALPAEWEICLATIVGGTIVPSTPVQSSTGAAVDFSAGNKIVSDGVPFIRIPTADGGAAVAFNGLGASDFIKVWSVADQAWKNYPATGVGDRPGYATATTVDGQVLISSGPMVSPIGRLKRVADDGTGYFKVQSVKKHGLATGNLVVVSADGWHGVTHREHPVNSPWSYDEETELAEVGSWEIEVIDPYWFKVPVAFVANSVFEQGQFWKADAVLIDAAPIYADLKDRVSDAGGGTIQLPAGHIWAEGPFHTLEGVNVRGAGKNATFFVQGDRNDVHFWSHTGEGGFSFSDVTLCCRRHRQDLTKGLHGWRIGSGTTISRHIEIIRCRIEAPPGYAVGFQADGAFTDCNIDIEANLGDSDIVDGKNRSEEEENQRNRVSAKFKHHGLWKIGTNFASYELPTDPFTMVNGSSIVTVRHDGNGFSPEIVTTFPNAGTVRGINMGGSWTIKGKVTNGYTIDVSPQVATSSGSGGGSGLLEQAAQFSKGDAGVDLRGEGWMCGIIEGEGDGRGRVMVRHRNIKESGYNSGSSFGDGGSIKVKNTGPSRTNAIGVTVGGKGINIPSVIGSGFAQLLNFQAGSQGCSIGLAQAIDCTVGGAMRGKDNSIGTLKAWTCDAGFAAYGGTTTDVDYLEDDSFYAEAGSNVVVVTRVDHGRTTGALATINNSEAEYGVDPDGTNMPITVINDDRFSIVVSSLATGTGAFGGDNATISWGTVQTNQNGTCGILQTIDCGVGAHIYEGAVGVQIGNRSSNGDTLSLIDCGTGTILYPATTIDSDVYKYASAVFTAGGEVTDTELGRIDTFAKAEKASGGWDLMLDYRLYGAVANSVASRVGLKRRTTATLIGTPTFTAYRGWKGDGVSAAINTGLNPATQGGSLYTGGNGRQFVAMQDNVAGTISASGVSSGGSARIRPRTGTDTISAQVMSALAAVASSVTTSAGYTAVERSGTAFLKGQRGSTIYAEVAVTSPSTTLPSGAVYNLARNNDGSVNEAHSGTIFASGIGAPLDDTKALAQAAAVEALMVAVGAA